MATNFCKVASSARWRGKRRRAVSEVVGTLLMLAIVVGLGVVVFTFASGSLSSLTQGFTNLMTGQGNAVSERFVVEQVAFDASPSVDASATGSFSAASSGSVTLTTTSPNDLIVVFVANEDTGGAVRTVSAVTASGLAFAERGSSVSTTASPYSEAEVWYAVSASPLSSRTITVTLSGTTDDASIVAMGVAGADTSSPWDAHSGLPSTASSNSGATSPGVSGVSTSGSPDLLLGFAGVFDASTHVPPAQTPGAGFTLLATQSNGGGTGKSQAAVEYQAVTSTQSGVTVGFGTPVLAQNAWIAIADAVQGNPGANVYIRDTGSLSATVSSVYVSDQSTGGFVGQFTVGVPVNVGAFVEVSQSTISFSPSHGHSYSFTVTSSRGNSVTVYAKYN